MMGHMIVEPENTGPILENSAIVIIRNQALTILLILV